MGSSFLFSLFFLYKSFTLSNPGSCHHNGLLQGNIWNLDLTLSSHIMLHLSQLEPTVSHQGTLSLLCSVPSLNKVSTVLQYSLPRSAFKKPALNHSLQMPQMPFSFFLFFRCLFLNSLHVLFICFCQHLVLIQILGNTCY